MLAFWILHERYQVFPLHIQFVTSWIIVMKIDNYFMQKLHRRLKFKIVEKEGKIKEIVNQSFPKAKSDEFMSFYKKI